MRIGSHTRSGSTSSSRSSGSPAASRRSSGHDTDGTSRLPNVLLSKDRTEDGEALGRRQERGVVACRSKAARRSGGRISRLMGTTARVPSHLEFERALRKKSTPASDEEGPDAKYHERPEKKHGRDCVYLGCHPVFDLAVDVEWQRGLGSDQEKGHDELVD